MDVAANTARRAYGLPSAVATVPSVAELAGRAWLVVVAAEALKRFDGPDGLQDVDPADLREVAGRPLLGGLLDVEGPLPTWEELHAHAAAGHLELGPFPVDGGHAAWLDVAGFAQVLDTTLPVAEDLLEQLRITSGDAGLAWAMTWLLERGWHATD
jgi:hypothetical protein